MMDKIAMKMVDLRLRWMRDHSLRALELYGKYLPKEVSEALQTVISSILDAETAVQAWRLRG